MIIALLVYVKDSRRSDMVPSEYDPVFQLYRPMNFNVRAKERDLWAEKPKSGTKFEALDHCRVLREQLISS